MHCMAVAQNWNKRTWNTASSVPPTEITALSSNKKDTPMTWLIWPVYERPRLPFKQGNLADHTMSIAEYLDRLKKRRHTYYLIKLTMLKSSAVTIASPLAERQHELTSVPSLSAFQTPWLQQWVEYMYISGWHKQAPEPAIPKHMSTHPIPYLVRRKKMLAAVLWNSSTAARTHHSCSEEKTQVSWIYWKPQQNNTCKIVLSIFQSKCVM
jgi:hypothetical protein